MLILYEILLAFYAVISFPVLLFKGKWHNGFAQRLGFFPKDLKSQLRHDKNIWIHAVSVGEVAAVAGLIRQLKERLSGYRIVLSTSTKTGYELAVQKFQQDALVIWAPLDFRKAAASFVDAIVPRAYIVAETELWPNLFSLLARKNIPIVLVNGRISDKAYPGYKNIRWFMRRFLHLVDSFCMQSDEDAERIIHLGAPPSKVHSVGNVKFDDLPKESTMSPEDLGFDAGDELWIAGSTHPGEEEIVLNVFKNIRGRYPRLRLVIAPRHVERTAEVMKLIGSKGFAPQKYSEMKAGYKSADAVILVDTIGHLRSLYSLATVVFVGKSFTVSGGHNIIEPAFFAKPVIIGPFMENFRDITAVFKADHALVQLDNPAELEGAMSSLLNSPTKRNELGQRARNVINKYTGATGRSVDFIVLALHQKP
jgi:3-deoxy-D-manno-octulosonic-acid transferase